MRFRLRSALMDVEAGLQLDRLDLPLELEGANTRLIWLASDHAEGGRIAGCKRWSANRWLGTVGFHPRYVLPQLEQRGLVRWDGDDLVVLEYIVNHEKRIRGLVEIQCPRMWAARGFGPLSSTQNGGVAPPSAPPSVSTIGGGSHRVNCAKVFKTPTIDQSIDQSIGESIDSGSGADLITSGSLRRTKSSEPPEPPEKDRSRVTGAETGPEGFEKWRAAMPIVRKARSETAARRWRDEDLEYWVRNDLEPEADEILAELERRKTSKAWQERRYIPSPIHFLRLASWRKVPRVEQPKVWGPPEIFEASRSWQAPERVRDELTDYLKNLADTKVLS